MFYEVEETTTFNPNAKGTLVTTGGGGELDKAASDSVTIAYTASKKFMRKMGDSYLEKAQLHINLVSTVCFLGVNV